MRRSMISLTAVMILTVQSPLRMLGAEGAMKWNYPSGNSVFGSNPAVGQNGTIYMSGMVSGNTRHKLFAVNPDGSLKWIYGSGGSDSNGAATSSPLIDTRSRAPGNSVCG